MASLDDYPLQPPPPGRSSNFIDPKSRGPVVVAVCYTSISLMWPILLSRLYSKARVIRRVGWDDGKPHLLLVRSMLTCENSILYTCRSAYHVSQISGDNKSKCKKIGATAETAGTIWLVGTKAIGPHGWFVLAALITANEQRVRWLE